MKPILRNFLILISPFLLMVLVNETMRPFINSKSNSNNKVSCINSTEANNNFCSWACHHNTTGHCIPKHTKLLKTSGIDPVYLGIINALKKGGYVLMNIFFLVILVPFCIWFFTIKALDIQDKINTQRKEQKLL